MRSKKKRVSPASRPASVPRPIANSRRPPYLLAASALAMLTLVAFSNSFTTGFALDSRMLLLGDPRIRHTTAENIGLILQHTYWWPNGESGLYRPLTTLSFLFNYAVWGNGEQSFGYHLVNFLLHAANVLLVFGLALHLLRGRINALRTAFLIAAVWAVHPLLTESVTNLAGRADLLAAGAVLGGFLLYLKSKEATGWRRVLWLIGLAAATSCGVFSKESAVVLPGLIVLYELVCSKNSSRRVFLRPKFLWGCFATIVPIVAMLWVRAIVLSSSPPAEWPFVDNPIVGAGFWTGRLTAIKVLARYAELAFWPMTLSSDYSYSEIPLARGSVNDWIAWLAVAAMGAVVTRLYYRDRLAFFFCGFALLTLLPGSNLLFPIGTIMAERLLYLPLIGLVAAVAIAMNTGALKYGVPQKAFLVFACLLIAALTARTWRRNMDWKDDLTMARASVQTSPKSFKVHRLLAAILLQSETSAANVDRATAEADKSVAILQSLPNYLDVPDPWTVAATSHFAKGNLLPQADASGQYRQAVQLALRSIAIEGASREAYDRRHRHKSPVPASAADAYHTLASAYLRLGQPELSLKASVQAKSIDPANAEVYRDIADAYLTQHRIEDAAITLAEGMFATRNGDLRSDLLKIYTDGGIDSTGCAVVSGPRGPALNPSCEIVRKDLCLGAARAHRPDLRAQLTCPD